MGFIPQSVEFDVKFNFVENLCKLHKKWLKYVLFGDRKMCFGFPSCIAFKSRIRVKVENELNVCFKLLFCPKDSMWVVGLFFVPYKKKREKNSAAHNNIELHVITTIKMKV